MFLAGCSQVRRAAPIEPANEPLPSTQDARAPTQPQWPEAFEADDGRVGFRRADGEVVLPARYMAVYPFNERGVAFVVDEGGWACIDAGGKVLLRPFVFDNGPDYVEEGLFRYVEGGKIGFANDACNVVIPAQWEFAGQFHNDRAPVCRGCKTPEGIEHATPRGGVWGFIDRQGKEVVPLQWEFVYPFNEDGSARVERNGIPRRIDRQGALLAVATPVRFVVADEGALRIRDALLDRRESLSACGDTFIEEDDGAGFVKVIIRGGPQAAAPVEVTGFGDDRLHACIVRALTGLSPTGNARTAHLTIRLGTPPPETEAGRSLRHTGDLVLEDDGTCHVIESFPCKPHKVCMAPERHDIPCPERIAPTR